VIVVKSVNLRGARPWLSRGLVLVLLGLAVWLVWPR
jgi:hypothetical protein